MYALMYPILYIASIHCYIPLSTATSISMCSVCIVLWHDHVNGEIKALKKKQLCEDIWSHCTLPQNIARTSAAMVMTVLNKDFLSAVIKLGWDTMPAILQAIYENLFSWMTIFQVCSIFIWNVPKNVHFCMMQHCLNHTSITWLQWIMKECYQCVTLHCQK